MISITFPSGDKEAAAVFGTALLSYAGTRVAGTPADVAAPYLPATDMAADAETNETAIADMPVGDGVANDEPALRAADMPVGGVDHNGVAKDPRYCGEWADPFYPSGKRKGAWKKKRGVTEEQFDAWYATQVDIRSNDSAVDAFTVDPLDTSGAFTAPVLDETAPVVEETSAPTNCGEFMTWVSEHQVAGRLSAADIGAAYEQLKVHVTDLFPPNDAATIAARIAGLYATLTAVLSDRG